MSFFGLNAPMLSTRSKITAAKQKRCSASCCCGKSESNGWKIYLQNYLQNYRNNNLRKTYGLESSTPYIDP